MAESGTTRLRVLLSAESFLPAMNGVVNSVLRVVEHLDRCGHDVLIVAPGPGPTSVELRSGRTVRVDRMRGVRVPRYRSLHVGLVSERRVAEVFDEFDPDVVHLAAPVVLGRAVGAVAAERAVPTVALFQTDLSGFVTDYGFSAAAAPIWRWLRRVHSDADVTLAPTPTVAAELVGHGFERVGVWGRGVDHEQFAPSRRCERFRAECGVGPGQILVGYVGRLAAEKRVDRLLALHDAPSIKLVLVGDGPERQHLVDLLPDAHFAGFRSGDELGRAMASLDVFVHTGLHETFCQTVQEAMAAGVAVAAPAAGGPIDLIDHEVDGLLYPADIEHSMADAVRRLADDDTLRRRLAEAGHVRVRGRTWSALGDELLAHYRRALVGGTVVRHRGLGRRRAA